MAPEAHARQFEAPPETLLGCMVGPLDLPAPVVVEAKRNVEALPMTPEPANERPPLGPRPAAPRFEELPPTLTRHELSAPAHIEEQRRPPSGPRIPAPRALAVLALVERTPPKVQAVVNATPHTVRAVGRAGTPAAADAVAPREPSSTEPLVKRAPAGRRRSFPPVSDPTPRSMSGISISRLSRTSKLEVELAYLSVFVAAVMVALAWVV